MYTVAGLPLHPLVVHAVVVLLPLAAVGTLAAAARPAWRRVLAIPTLLVALAGAVAVPLASSSGWQLRRTMGGGSPLVAEHARARRSCCRRPCCSSSCSPRWCSPTDGFR